MIHCSRCTTAAAVLVATIILLNINLPGLTLAGDPTEHPPKAITLAFRGRTDCLMVLGLDRDYGPERVVLLKGIDLAADGCLLCDSSGRYPGIPLMLTGPSQSVHIDEEGDVRFEGMTMSPEDDPSFGKIEVFRPRNGVKVPTGKVVSRKEMAALGEFGRAGFAAGWVPKFSPVRFRVVESADGEVRLVQLPLDTRIP